MESLPAITKSPEKASAVSSGKKPSSFFKSVVQTKLTVNSPNDVYEQEADVVADKVMRMDGAEALPSTFFKPAIPSISRMCDHCAEEERPMQRKEINEDKTITTDNFEKYVGNLNSSGQSLPGEVRNFYESRMGHDFSQVKVHTDTVAAKSAQSINALAYTSGNNIVFNNGQYAPGSDSGKSLLAHELTHVVQQGSAIQTKLIQRARLPCVSNRTIDVYAVSLPGSTRDPFADIATANGFLCQCGIELNATGGQSLETNLMDRLPPVNVLNEYSSPGSPTAEETEMLSFRPGGDVLHIYFVPALSAGSLAESFWTSKFPTVSNAVVVANSAIVCTLAHEVGHVLLNDGTHHGNPDNLMASGSVNTCAGELEPSQCSKM